MPVIAVGAAIFSGASIAAAGGLAAFAASSGVFAAIAAVGSIVSAVGVVTGNETLTKIGAVAGLVGGVGALAKGAGMFGAADAAKTGAANAGSASAGATTGLNNPSAYVGGAAAESATTATAGLQAAAAPTAPLADAGQGLMGQAAAAEPAAALNMTRAADSQAAYAAGAANVTEATKGATLFDTLVKGGEWMNKNKELAAMGSNLVGGMFDDQKQATADLLNVRADNEKQQMANANAVPSLSGMRLKPNTNVFNNTPQTYRPVRVGLINSPVRTA